MNIVYRVRRDGDYQYLLPTARGGMSKLSELNCSSREADWTPIQMYNPVPTSLETDFYQPRQGFFIISEKAYRHMGQYFRSLGEVLPLVCDEPHCPDGPIYAVNILECVNCLDHDKTRWRTSQRRTDEYVFNASRLPFTGFFKIPEQRGTRIFAQVDTALPEDEWITTRIRDYGLQGLRFEVVWEE